MNTFGKILVGLAVVIVVERVIQHVQYRQAVKQLKQFSKEAEESYRKMTTNNNAS